MSASGNNGLNAYAEALKKKDFARAEKIARKLLKKNPGDGRMLKYLGTVQAIQGKNAEALPRLEQAAGLLPGDAELLKNLAQNLEAMGRDEEAARRYLQMLDISPDSPSIHVRLAAIFGRAKNLHQARDHARRASELDPHNWDALMKLARAHHELEEPQKAKRLYQKVLTMNPEHPPAYSSLGSVCRELNNPEEAREHLQRALELEPDSALHHTRMGSVCKDLKLYEEARDHYLRALEIDPHFEHAHSRLGNAYKHLGQISDALKSYRRALELDPDSVQAHYGLSELTTFDDPDDPAIKRLQARFMDSETDPHDRALAGFALGKAMLDQKRLSEAFDCYDQANRIMYPLREGGPDWDIRPARYQRLFSGEFMARAGDFGLQETPQVFVVGFSRSGKSLVESLIACHPDIEPWGEDQKFHRFCRGKGKNYLQKLTPEKSRQEARNYIREHQFPPGRGRCVTTLPGNITVLGYLGLYFPATPIIFVQRDLKDLGVSCYFKHYARGNRYAFDLEHLGREIRLYRELIKHWTQVLPNPMLMLSYEELTRNPDGMCSMLYSFLGLEWKKEYFKVLKERSSHVLDLGPAHSLDLAMPIRKDFVGFSEPFRDRLGPLLQGYRNALQDTRYDQPAGKVLAAGKAAGRKKMAMA
ncbi:TPR repeat-containing protein [Desulfonatronospira thiodismutans ASO3-1]|uniref:TPR repeat-containing protein n=1 Tax=Desulfonatronospira thiodismutans ASO3-1 TaxID=555779 RepID=D6STX8_9BACT|nr:MULTISPECIES: tetratricopeptide repeat-containing sulfotransferase family protein [Desulfonatronospira]EFI34144.1 TPR repeat-containing protein [Desulfonatronospira thiodismutans ASO3-1]RQD75611.1 MAG: sulfotransferase family protein [Desulfonatronospira sp. MSAO_Bac3]